MKEIMILSANINVDNLTVDEANDYIDNISVRIHESLKNDTYDVRCIIIPVQKQETEIKCIYPKYIGNNEKFFNWFDDLIIELEKPESLIGNMDAPIKRTGIDSLIEQYKNIRNNFDETGEFDMKFILTKLDQIKEMLNENKNFEEQIKK